MITDKNSIGGYDIGRVKLIPEAKPQATALITGLVLDQETQKPISCEIRYQRLSDPNESGISMSSPIDGSYTIPLLCGESYLLTAATEGYVATSENIDLGKSTEHVVIHKNIMLNAIKAATVIRLNNVFFDSGKSILKPESYFELDQLLALFQERPSMKVEIAGHTDDVGDDAANLKLSEARAQAVVDYFLSKGIASQRIIAKGYGETKFISPNDSPEGRQLNRRVEFVILQK